MTKALDLSSSFLDQLQPFYDRRDYNSLAVFEDLYPDLREVLHARYLEAHEAKRVEHQLNYRKQIDNVFYDYRSHTERIEDTCYEYRRKRHEFSLKRRLRYASKVYHQRSAARNEGYKAIRLFTFRTFYVAYLKPMILTWLPNGEREWPDVRRQLLYAPMDDRRWDYVLFPWFSSCHIDPQMSRSWRQQQEQRATKHFIESKATKVERILQKLQQKHNGS